MVGRCIVLIFRSRRKRGRGRLLVLGMLGVACGSLNSEFRGAKYKGDYFVYRTQKGDPDVCAGAVDRLEEHALVLNMFDDVHRKSEVNGSVGMRNVVAVEFIDFRKVRNVAVFDRFDA